MAQAQQKDDSDQSDHPRGKPPVDKFQEGPFQVSIWQNPSSKGDFRTAKIERRYKDKESGGFRTSHSYSASDLEHLAKAAEEARARITRWEEENRSQGQTR